MAEKTPQKSSNALRLAQANTPPEPQFLFVDSTSSTVGKQKDGETRRRIRKHIMRDIGRSRRKKTRNPQFELELVDHAGPSTSSPSSTSNIDTLISDDVPAITSDEGLKSALPGIFWDEHPLTVVDTHWGVDPFVAYALAMALASSKNRPCTHTGCFWFPFAFRDSTFFRRMLTGTDVEQSFLRETLAKSQNLGLARYNGSLGSLQRQLADPDVAIATSDGVVRGIIGLICYNYVTREFAQAEVHLAGLERMISLRGGVASFGKEHNLWLMVFWIDVTAALLRDRAPRFPLPPAEVLPVVMPRPQTLAFTMHYDAMAEMCPVPNPQNFQVVKSLRALKDLSMVIELELLKRGDSLWHDEVFMGLRLNPIAHSLLSTLSTEPAMASLDSTLEAARLGCLIFVLALKEMTHTFPDTDAGYASRVLAVLENDATGITPSSNSAYVALRLWLLVMCSISSLSSNERVVVTIDLVQTMDLLGLDTWDEVMAKVRTMPWVDAAFESRGPTLEALKEDVLRLKSE